MSEWLAVPRNRFCDHPALRAALDAHDEVVAVFCLYDRLLRGRTRQARARSPSLQLAIHLD